MKGLFSKRLVLVGCAVLVTLFFVRPPASRLKSRVLGSMSAALGRNVEVSSVRIRFLPRPGFELGNLVIHDNPAFGAEPLLRAPDVTAWLQVGALLHGRIEIATLILSDASLNLTRNDGGAWNFEDLLERASRITVAPTAARRRASRPQFPYIESSGTRINFKTGAEKTHFALTDTKLALWQESENAWGMRLQAQPIRTDANLTDTGVINVSGMWGRSARVHETPVQFLFEWKRAQIGQISSLAYGSDKGWRGGASISGQVTGTPESLKITGDGSVDNFRRRDVLGGSDQHLAAHCTAQYSITRKILSNVDCAAPSGDGVVELTGSASAGPLSNVRIPAYDFRLLASNVPAQSALTFLRHANPNFASELSADGKVNATFEVIRNEGQAAHWQGGGELQELRLSSSRAQTEVSVGTIPFSLIRTDAGPVAAYHTIRRVPKPAKNNPALSSDLTQQPEIAVGPINVAMGRPSPLQVRALVWRSGYEAAFRGDAAVRRLLQSASILGLPVPAVNAEGTTSFDVKVTGLWNGQRPTILGTAQLRGVYAQLRGVNGPLSIARANLTLAADSVRVTNLNASAADATWQGSLRIPRPCASPADCEFQFNLHADEVSAASLNNYLNPAQQKRSWYKFLSLAEDRPRFLMQARGSGKISIDNLLLGGTSCMHFATGLRVDAGRITLSAMNGELFGGTIAGDWEADFDAKPAKYSGNGTLAGVSLEDVASLMHDGWVAGSGDAKYDFTATGWNLRDLLRSAELNADFSISDGSFPHIVLTSASGALSGEDFSGNIRLHAGEFSINDAKLVSQKSVYTVSGTASLTGELNLKIGAEGAPGFLVSGTILQTRVSANPTTAASLKP